MNATGHIDRPEERGGGFCAFMYEYKTSNLQVINSDKSLKNSLHAINRITANLIFELDCLDKLCCFICNSKWLREASWLNVQQESASKGFVFSLAWIIICQFTQRFMSSLPYLHPDPSVMRAWYMSKLRVIEIRSAFTWPEFILALPGWPWGFWHAIREFAIHSYHMNIVPVTWGRLYLDNPWFPARVPTYQFTCFSLGTTVLQPINFCSG